ncbi:hypothetical protein ACIPSA_13340 [Streptomyces sp. NPDC086549]|uniref:hypothetical protein n=1 Tax=Streptomyces sp. NPDC086549 TaxID=3365752 RepID=UPI0038160FB3
MRLRSGENVVFRVFCVSNRVQSIRLPRSLQNLWNRLGLLAWRKGVDRPSVRTIASDFPGDLSLVSESRFLGHCPDFTRSPHAFFMNAWNTGERVRIPFTRPDEVVVPRLPRLQREVGAAPDERPYAPPVLEWNGVTPFAQVDKTFRKRLLEHHDDHMTCGAATRRGT